MHRGCRETMVKRLDELGGALVVGANLEPDGPLRRRRGKLLRIEIRRYLALPAEAV